MSGNSPNHSNSNSVNSAYPSSGVLPASHRVSNQTTTSISSSPQSTLNGVRLSNATTRASNSSIIDLYPQMHPNEPSQTHQFGGNGTGQHQASRPGSRGGLAPALPVQPNAGPAGRGSQTNSTASVGTIPVGLAQTPPAARSNHSSVQTSGSIPMMYAGSPRGTPPALKRSSPESAKTTSSSSSSSGAETDPEAMNVLAGVAFGERAKESILAGEGSRSDRRNRKFQKKKRIRRVVVQSKWPRTPGCGVTKGVSGQEETEQRLDMMLPLRCCF